MVTPVRRSRVGKCLRTVPASPVAARSVAIINSPVDGRSTSAICTIGPATSSSGTIGVGPLAGAVVNFNNQWFDTLTARIGYSFAAPWSFYFQGGGAWSHTSTDATLAGVALGQTSKTRSGWTIGGGVEWMFAPHWSAFLEGNWMDFGSNDRNIVTAGAPCPPPGCFFNTKATEATVLVGVNYRFW